MKITIPSTRKEIAMFKHKLTAAVIGTVICTSIFTYSVADVTTPTNTTVTGTFTSCDNSLTADYNYNDNYFLISAQEQNESLRTMSLALAISAYEKKPDSKGNNINDVLEKTGFDTSTVQSDEMDVTRTDSVGSVIASKFIKGKPLISVTVRGTDYKAEWASNFNSGTQGDAKGFSESSQKLIERIKSYEQRYSIKGAKLWITGYSRGGGISDLTGKYINEHLDEFGISPDDIYVYTFEAPRACTVQTNYKNIHNICCDMDVIPKLYPQSWGLYHAGTPEKLDFEPKQITLKELSISDGFGLKDTDEKMTLCEFEDKLISWLTDKISREKFDSDFKPITDIIVDIISSPAQQQREKANYFRAVLNSVGDHFKNSKLALLRIAGILGSGSLKKSSIKYLSDTLISKMDDTDHSKAYSDEKYKQLKGSVPDVIELAVDLLKSDMKDNDLKYIPTFASYASQIVQYHITSNIWQAVIKTDSNYTASAADLSEAA